MFVVRLLLDPVALLRGQSVRGLREDLTTVSLPCYDLSPLCVGVWFVRPSAFVRPVVGLPRSPSVVAYLSGKKINFVSTDPSALCRPIT